MKMRNVPLMLSGFISMTKNKRIARTFIKFDNSGMEGLLLIVKINPDMDESFLPAPIYHFSSQSEEEFLC
jgi:hypothetical protein